MTIWKNRPPFIIAEVAQSHDGSLGQAHAFVDAAASTGAHAIKFQTHIAAAESTPEEPWRVKFSYQDDLRYDYWKRMQFTEEQWAGLKNHAEEKGLCFLSSPFSIEAVDLLERLNVEAWKVASGETSNPLLLDAMLATGKPMIVSTGMSSWDEIDRLVERLRRSDCEYSLLQCTSEYPCPPEKWGLNVIGELQQRYDCAVGLSDHSGTIYPALAATALGAELIEVHVTLSEYMFGPDVPASVSVEGLRQLVEGCAAIKTAAANPIDKDGQSESASRMRRIFGQVLMLRHALAAGAVIQKSDLTSKKSNGGIPVHDIDQVIGRRLKNATGTDTALQPDDFL